MLLHAGVADRTMWAEHLEPLAAAGYRVVAMDLPGFGEAPLEPGPLAHWEDVLATMDELGVGQAAFVGSSFGAAVALRVAVVAPDRVRSLLLFSVPPTPDADPSPQLAAVWEAEEDALQRGDIDAAVEAVVTAWVPGDASPELRQRVAGMQRRAFELQARATEVEDAPDPIDEPDVLARIDLPVLLAVGEYDMPDFKLGAEDLERNLPRATRVVLPEVGHLAPLEAPEIFRDLVIETLQRPPRSTRPHRDRLGSATWQRDLGGGEGPS